MTKASISINRKNKETNEFEKDFSGYVVFVGSAVAKRALSLQRGDRIKLGDTDVSAVYNKDEHKMYYNFKVFDYELISGEENARPVKKSPEAEPEVEEGEVGEQFPF